MKNQLNIVLGEVCRQGLAEGVYAGVTAAVSYFRNSVRYRAVYSDGVTRFGPTGTRVEPTTLFDLASLTKPLCTTLCLLHLFADNKTQLNDPILPVLGFGPSQEKENITVLDILLHSSGLPAYQPYFKTLEPHYTPEHRTTLLKAIVNEQLIFPPGGGCEYSDLGFILLGEFIERVGGAPLNQLFRSCITEHMQLTDQLLFLPAREQSRHFLRTIAATEDCPWRQRVIQGEVHDEHCWLMGGVAGHAGLFGTGEAVLRLCECLLDSWHGRIRHPAVPGDWLNIALHKKAEGNTRCMGFDTPSPEGSSSGRYFSQRTVGHLGFTGTSFWIDHDRNLVVVLLTNRVHPTRENTKIKEFRPFFHDYIVERIG